MSYDVVWSQHPHAAIRDYVKDIAVDLVVKDLQIESQLKCALLGPPTAPGAPVQQAGDAGPARCATAAEEFRRGGGPGECRRR
ncbi:hypothetical protein QNM99_20475 [Pseudomonas sp. PCH446]